MVLTVPLACRQADLLDAAGPCGTLSRQPFRLPAGKRIDSTLRGPVVRHLAFQLHKHGPKANACLLQGDMTRHEAPR